MQAKALAQNNRVVQQENAALMAENASLRHAILTGSCLACGGATTAAAPAELPPESRRLVAENARLRGEYARATALLNQILLSVSAPAPPGPAAAAVVVSSSSVARPVAHRAARLRGHAEAAMDQFLLLATKGEPLWLPTTPDRGEALNYQLGCQQKKALPVHHGLCPDEFVMEASRATGVVRASAAYLVATLTDAVRSTCTHVFSGPFHSCTNRKPEIWCLCLSIRGAGLRCSPASWRV
jgi:homeobox-leucine zipper protein